MCCFHDTEPEVIEEEVNMILFVTRFDSECGAAAPCSSFKERDLCCLRSTCVRQRSYRPSPSRQDKNTIMAEVGSTSARPFVDWSQFAEQRKNLPEPVIYISHEKTDDGYGKFRKLSHKVAKRRYDIPWGHNIIIAYAKRSGCPTEAVGAITYWVAESGNTQNDSSEKKPENFMDDNFHKISFLFVDQSFQRKGIGSKLIKEALQVIRQSQMDRPVHLEAANSAVKFFRKMGFTSCGKMEGSATGRCGLFRICHLMEHRFTRL